MFPPGGNISTKRYKTMIIWSECLNGLLNYIEYRKIIHTHTYFVTIIEYKHLEKKLKKYDTQQKELWYGLRITILQGI